MHLRSFQEKFGFCWEQFYGRKNADDISWRAAEIFALNLVRKNVHNILISIEGTQRIHWMCQCVNADILRLNAFYLNEFIHRTFVTFFNQVYLIHTFPRVW